MPTKTAKRETEEPKEVTHAGAASSQKEAEDMNTKMIYGPRGDEGEGGPEAKEPKTAPQKPIKANTQLVTREEPTKAQLKAREEAAGVPEELRTGGTMGGPVAASRR